MREPLNLGSRSRREAFAIGLAVAVLLFVLLLLALRNGHTATTSQPAAQGVTAIRSISFIAVTIAHLMWIAAWDVSRKLGFVRVPLVVLLMPGFLYALAAAAFEIYVWWPIGRGVGGTDYGTIALGLVYVLASGSIAVPAARAILDRSKSR